MTTQLNNTRARDGIKSAIGILRQRFGERLDTGRSVREQHGHTTTWIENQPPDAVAFPQNTMEVAEIVQICSSYNTPVIPFGTGTSLEGHVNAPEGGVSIDVSNMNKIIAVNAEDLDCVVEPGVTRTQLNTYLRDQGLFFPIDPGADASLGGMAATRASGTNAVRYGTMKDNVLAVEAVLASGEVIRTGTRARKSSAGYDLTRLLVGSEGTLGVITNLTLRLHGIPEVISSARCTFPTIDAACNAVIETIQMGIPVARIELLDDLTVQAVNAYSDLELPQQPVLLLEFHGSESGTDEQAKTFHEIAEDFCGTGFAKTTQPEERSKLWQARHDAYWATLALRPGSKGLSTDVCVPLSRLADCVSQAKSRAEELGLLAPILGHVGDGNFHALLLIDPASDLEVKAAEEFVGWLNSLAISMDGTCTGEHGVGQGKAPYLEREAGSALAPMKAIKDALDPLNIMNPGKLFI